MGEPIMQWGQVFDQWSILYMTKTILWYLPFAKYNNCADFVVTYIWHVVCSILATVPPVQLSSSAVFLSTNII